jgi:hypothetical protein
MTDRDQTVVVFGANRTGAHPLTAPSPVRYRFLTIRQPMSHFALLAKRCHRLETASDHQQIAWWRPSLSG